MKRGKKLIGLGVVIILGLSLILVPLLSRLSPAQAAVTWTKSGANPVFIDSVVSGAACVLYDSDEGIYKMWYAHGTTDLNEIDSLIGNILSILGSGLINDIKNLDFGAIADNDATNLKNIIDYLEGLTVAQLEALLVGTSSIISYATSPDGINNWAFQSTVLLPGTGDEWDKYYVGDPCVIKNSTGDYEMWYTGGTMDLSAVAALLDDLSLLTKENISTILGDIVDLDIGAFITHVREAQGDAYLLELIADLIDVINGAGVAIGHATLTNGDWVKDANPVLTKGAGDKWDEYGVATPCVIPIGDTYKMWYTGCGIDYTTLKEGLLGAENLDDIVAALLGGINVAIGHATLTNGDWVKDTANNPVLSKGTAGAWDGYGVGTPWVLRHSSTNYEMWYTGAKMVPNTLLNFLRHTSDLETAIISGTNIAIGHATSTNGIAWTPDANPVLEGTDDKWDEYGVGAPCVIKMGDTYKMWYTGVKSNLSTFIRDILDGSNFATALDSSDTRIAIGYASYTVPAPEEPEPPPPPPPPPGITEVSDIVTGEGVFTEEVTAKSEDENVSVTIDEGTIGLTAEGEPLSEISIIEMEEPPAPPEDSNVIGLAYDFGPDEATFNPPITVKFIVDPATLPPGVAVEDLVIAYYNEEAGEWVELPTTFDPVTNTLMADVSHFTIFAIITVVPVVAPPAPAAFSVSSLSIQPAEVGPSEAVTITVLVANTGGESGSYTVVLKINGVKEAEERVTIAAGSSQTVTFSVTKEEAGSYTVAVDGLSGSFTVVPVVVPPAPAAFSVSYLFVSPRLEVEPGETVTIAVLVANTGGESGSYTAVLKIDGVKEAEERVTIAAGESQDVSFSVTKDVAGTYSVDVSGLTGSFTVKEEVVTPVTPAEVAEGIAWWVWLIVGLGVVVIGGLLAYFLWWKRRIA